MSKSTNNGGSIGAGCQMEYYYDSFRYGEKEKKRTPLLRKSERR